MFITEDSIADLCKSRHLVPITVKRFLIGQGNYVFYVQTADGECVVRCGKKSYYKTVYLLKKLNKSGIQVSKPMCRGKYKDFYYMICTYIKGEDLGKVYHTLSDDDKKEIAKKVISIQRKVSEIHVLHKPSWESQIQSLLCRAKERISANEYFDTSKVDTVEKLMPQFHAYFVNLHSVAYLDDISTKNLLVHNKRVSGIIDVDWLGCGDPLSFVALTHMALLDMQCDASYVNYLLAEMHISESEYKVFLFYTLLYCVDFMGERGMTFCGKSVEVNPEIIHKLNGIYEKVFAELQILLQS